MAPKAKRGASNTPKAKAAPAKAAAKPGARPPSNPPPKAAASKAAPAAKAAAGKAAPPAKDPAAEAAAAEEAKKKEEEEAKAAAEAAEKKAAQEAELAQMKAAAEAEAKRLAALANGEVTIKYSHYNEKFPIKDNKLTAADIDETYCLSFVMPGCFLHLAEKEKFEPDEERVFIQEDPPGTFLGLLANETYWCHVQQDPEQEERDKEATRQRFAGGVATGIGDRGSEKEGCSCKWGAPCTDATICEDWDHRYANAKQAGGNPLLFK